MSEKWVEFGDILQYRVSSQGKVQTRYIRGTRGLIDLFLWKDKKLSLARSDKHGGTYLKTMLKIDGKNKTEYVHRIVAKYHIGEIGEGLQVNHIDGNRFNNNVSNLEIVSPKENMRNAVDRGSFNNVGVFRGKIDEIKGLTILTFINAGFSNKYLASHYNIDPSNISKFRNNKNVYKSLQYLLDDNIIGLGR